MSKTRCEICKEPLNDKDSGRLCKFCADDRYHNAEIDKNWYINFKSTNDSKPSITRFVTLEN